MSNREQALREALELIANGEWVTDSSAQELARQALTQAADAAEPLKLLAENYERQINEIQEICLEAGIVPVEEGGDCKTIVEAVRRLASPSAVLTEATNRVKHIRFMLFHKDSLENPLPVITLLDELEALLSAPAQPKVILKCPACGHIAEEGDTVGIVGCSRCSPTRFYLSAPTVIAQDSWSRDEQNPIPQKPTAATEVRRDRIDNTTRDTPGEGKL